MVGRRPSGPTFSRNALYESTSTARALPQHERQRRVGQRGVERRAAGPARRSGRARAPARPGRAGRSVGSRPGCGGGERDVAGRMPVLRRDDRRERRRERARWARRRRRRRRRRARRRGGSRAARPRRRARPAPIDAHTGQPAPSRGPWRAHPSEPRPLGETAARRVRKVADRPIRVVSGLRALACAHHGQDLGQGRQGGRAPEERLPRRPQGDPHREEREDVPRRSRSRTRPASWRRARSSKVDELAAHVRREGLRRGRGAVGTFQGKPQLRIETRREGRTPRRSTPPSSSGAPPPEPKKPEKPAAERGATSTLWKELLGLVDVIAIRT